MNTLIDLIPAALFYAAYHFYGFFVATGVLIAASLAMLLVEWLRTRKVKKMHVLVAIFAVVFGGLTLWKHDTEFLKMKLSVLYGLFSLCLLGSQFVGKTVLLQRIGHATIQLPEVIWRRLNIVWALFFAACALLNFYIAQHFSEAVWVNFKFYGVTILTVLFTMLHAPFLARYLEPDPKDDHAR
jgi:intracellular septation protein